MNPSRYLNFAQEDCDQSLSWRPAPPDEYYIYRLQNPRLCYVGSTGQTPARRRQQHLQDSDRDIVTCMSGEVIDDLRPQEELEFYVLYRFNPFKLAEQWRCTPSQARTTLEYFFANMIRDRYVVNQFGRLPRQRFQDAFILSVDRICNAGEDD